MLKCWAIRGLRPPTTGGYAPQRQFDMGSFTGLKGQRPPGLKGQRPLGLKGQSPPGLKGQSPPGLKGQSPFFYSLI